VIQAALSLVDWPATPPPGDGSPSLAAPPLSATLPGLRARGLTGACSLIPAREARVGSPWLKGIGDIVGDGPDCSGLRLRVLRLLAVDRGVPPGGGWLDMIELVATSGYCDDRNLLGKDCLRFYLLVV
jgi:hypothetical protein